MKELNIIEFRNAIQEDKKVVIKFGASWCGECRAVESKLDTLSQEHTDMDFYSLDVDKYMEVAEEFGINELPVLIAFKKGKEISRWCEPVGDLAGWLNMLTW